MFNPTHISAAPRAMLPKEARSELHALAPKIWNYFAQFATAQDHWLPPDNVRIEPNPAVAHRTSPTNIGYLLIAIVAAFDFKLLTADDVLARLEKIFTTLESMKRFRGH